MPRKPNEKNKTYDMPFRKIICPSLAARPLLLNLIIHEENHFSTFSGRTLSVKEKNDQLAVLVEYVSETFHLHNLYAFKFFFCELVIKPSC